MGDIDRDSDHDLNTRAQTKRSRTPASEASARGSDTGREKADADDGDDEDQLEDEESPNDPKPEKQLWKMKWQRALADANKPIEAAAEAIWSSDPDKVKARTAIEQAYRAAAREGSDRHPEGELHVRYRKADEKFVDAANDMLRSGHGRDEGRDSHLERWIRTNLTSGTAPVRAKLRERQQVATRLTKRLGPRERARQDAIDTTKRWEKAFARWSSPDKEIGAQIASYFDRIDQLNADINTNNNRDQAIFSFWFEVAPSHLQLREDKVSAANTPGVNLIMEALKEFPELKDIFKSGNDRKDGSLYLLEPHPDPVQDNRLRDKRREILKGWQDSAADQAKAEADYSTRPDAAADLKPRHDKLKDDGWVKSTKEVLATPKP
jgi:hypothetical protein